MKSAGTAPATASSQSRSRPRHQRGLLLRALEDDAMLGLVRRVLDGGVEHRLVLDDAVRLDPAGRRDDDARLGVVDPGGQLVRGETAEDHRVDGPQPRAGQHGDQRLGDHRHVDDDPVALLDAERRQRPGEARDLVAQLARR